MTKQGFGKLVSLQEAIDLIASITQEKEEETINLQESLGRILSQDIVANINVPHFRKSAMDGFAVLAEDTYGASNNSPKKLKIIEHITAGDIPSKELRSGECIEITTGACMPDSANAVLMVEYTEKTDNELLFYKALAPEENVIKIGSDVKKDSVVLHKGAKLNSRYLGVLSAVGISQVSVKKKPIVSLLSTGNELLELDEALVPGKIYDINTTTLSHAILEQGCELVSLGLVKDNRELIKQQLEKGIAESDIVILSGGSSLGTEDMTKEIIQELGTLHVHGIAVKPGKPVIIGEAKGKILLGLPGYPTSALSNFYILVIPVLHKMMGTSVHKDYVTAQLSRKIASTIGRYEFLAVKIVEENGVRKAVPVMKGSSSITTMAESDGFLEIDENTEVLNKDDEVLIRRF